MKCKYYCGDKRIKRKHLRDRLCKEGAIIKHKSGKRYQVIATNTNFFAGIIYVHMEKYNG